MYQLGEYAHLFLLIPPILHLPHVVPFPLHLPSSTVCAKDFTFSSPHTFLSPLPFPLLSLLLFPFFPLHPPSPRFSSHLPLPHLLPPSPPPTHTPSQIEQHVVHVLEWEATQSTSSRLSPEELVYAKDFADNMDTHLHSLVLRHMPSNLQRIDRKKAGGLLLC